MPERPVIVIPGDDPSQFGGTPQLERLRTLGEVVIYPSRPESTEEKIARVRDADIIINSRGIVTWGAEEFAALPRLQMLTTCSIGVDSIDLAAARSYGKTVCNVPLATVPMVAEHLFGLMLAVAKQVALQTAEIKAGRWNKPYNVFLRGKTLGVVGTGNIGAELVRLGKAIGMEVIAWTFNPSSERATRLGIEFVELEELMVRADVVSLNVKLTPDTRHLISERELGLMKNSAILINGARGRVVDEEALCRVLDAGKLYGVGLDVFPEEPVASDASILAYDRVVMTPHAADQTPEAMDAVNSAAVENVAAYLAGRPTNIVSS